jgi:uncharacterized protein (DUF58 family)
MTRGRWDVGIGAALFVLAFGLLLAEPVLVAGSVIGLGYALYGSVSRLPGTVELAATREFRMDGTGPGELVDVTVRVENTGESVLPDVRVADGVPEELGVVEGSPRGAFALAPGEVGTIEYTVVLQRGRFEFEAPVVRTRSLAATDRRTREVPADGDRALLCSDTAMPQPASDSTLQYAGTVPTDSGGSGLEFYSTRQYHSGDPMSRIHWHQVAKTGDFVTVQYRHERAARTVVVVDCRPPTRVTPWAGYPTVGSLSAYAAERVYDALQERGVVTSLTAVGLDEELPHLAGADGLRWNDPGSDDGAATALFRGTHRAATAEPTSLSLRPPSPVTGVATAPTPRPDGGDGQERELSDRTERLLSRLPADAKVVFCSPVLDNWPVEFGRELTVRGYSCTLVSPDGAAGPGYGQRLGAIHRRLRLRALERSGVAVTDWPIDQPVEYALRRTLTEI